MHINIAAVDVEKLIPMGKKIKKPESSKKIRERVEMARQIQERRFKEAKIYVNANMKNSHVKKYVKIDKDALMLLKKAVNTYNLSARTYFRLIKVSQTIADLGSEKKILPNHVAEALQYRIRVQE